MEYEVEDNPVIPPRLMPACPCPHQAKEEAGEMEKGEDKTC
jgi:hypothetical protein